MIGPQVRTGTHWAVWRADGCILVGCFNSRAHAERAAARIFTGRHYDGERVEIQQRIDTTITWQVIA